MPEHSNAILPNYFDVLDDCAQFIGSPDDYETTPPVTLPSAHSCITLSWGLSDVL
ncbi:hypothetical protein J6590_072900 [Homalodisca vitripennis]|nr:hypothetical protein J6590_072900 [Homalodisca vitripennis]